MENPLLDKFDKEFDADGRFVSSSGRRKGLMVPNRAEIFKDFVHSHLEAAYRAGYEEGYDQAREDYTMEE